MNASQLKVLLIFIIAAQIYFVSASADDQPQIDQTTNAASIDLSHWKLTLPTNESGDLSGHAQEISSTKLANGFSNPHFYRSDDGSLVFWCPVEGAKTEGTDYSRSELREMTKRNDPSVNWDSSGTHVMTARLRVLQVPSNPKVVIGQIHGYGSKTRPLIKLQYFKGRIEALVKSRPSKGKDIKLQWPDIGLNQDIDYEIKVDDGVLLITVNGVTQTQNIIKNDPEWGELTFYFKAGVYPQDDKGGDDEGAKAVFSRLSVRHQ